MEIYNAHSFVIFQQKLRKWKKKKESYVEEGKALIKLS